MNPNKQESEEVFKQINEAYQVLSNPEERAAYDRWRAGGHASQNEPEMSAEEFIEFLRFVSELNLLSELLIEKATGH